jgi:DNA topoisomerase IB
MSRFVETELDTYVTFFRRGSKAFCPTGPGGGINPHCGTGGTRKLRSGEVLHSANRGPDKIWRDEKGEPLPEHVQKLKLPPSFNKDGTPNPKAPVGVHFNLDPKGDCLAIFKNTKGKDVRIYGDSHTMAAAADKFGRVSELRKKRKQIFSEIDADIKAGENTEEASALKLIMQTGMRPGGDADTGADYKSYGATTLEGRHVVETPQGVAMRFVPGKKKGQEIEMPIHDTSFGKSLLKRAKAVGPEGRLFDTTAGKVRQYSKTKDGGGFKTKDHRTALGTEIAIAAIKKSTPPKTMTEYKKMTKSIATEVSSVLGNTPLIAIKDYIDPQVWVGWKTKVGA